MSKFVVSAKFCKLRQKQVSVEMKAVQGLDSSSPQEYVANACLAKDALKCLELNCTFATLGGQYPF